MPLTNNALPSIVPGRALPLDVSMLIAQNQTFTASGYANNGAATTQIDLGNGRFDGLLVLDMKSLKVSAGNETVLAALLGSNDPTFTAGNMETLVIKEFAAAAGGRIIPNILPASPVIPTPNESVRRYAIPFSTLQGGYVLRYAQLYLLMGGTAPSVSLTSWITDRESMV